MHCVALLANCLAAKIEKVPMWAHIQKRIGRAEL
jgi:hypothetical protein